MTQVTILGIPCDEYKKKTTVRLVICIAIALVVLAISIALYCTVTSQTKIAFTVINSVIDIACVWWLLYYGINILSVRYKLLKIYRKASQTPCVINGVIESISASQKVFGFDCATVALETEDGVRKIFVIENSFGSIVGEGKSVRFSITDNIAVIAEVENEE